MLRKETNPFTQLGLRPWLAKQLTKLGLKQATPIQENCIPAILEGKDCIGAAETGSGKTFAFALPILEKLSEEPTSHFALVLTPTHELAYQISEQFLVAGQPMGVRVCVVSGGTDQIVEAQKLMQRPHIVVAMPGRLADHLTGCDTFSFDNLKFLVVDEADRMLNGDFDESLKVIERCLPKERQNLFFSATMKDFIKESSIFPIAKDCLEWSEEFQTATVETLDQRYLLCADYERDMVLIEALRKYREDDENSNVMIFTNTKKYCQLLSMTLNSIGIDNVCLHGFMRQKERVAALNRFKSKHVRTLIATDVAARGLDIPSVQLVINHRLPRTPKEYIHRVGRTARAGRKGMAISIFRFPRDLELLGEIEEAINTKLTEHPIDQKMVERIFMQVNVSRRESEIQLDNNDFDERAQNYRRKQWIIEGKDPDEMENLYRKKQKDKLREIKRQRKERLQELQNKEPSTLIQDERFKSVDTQRFEKKKKSKKNTADANTSDQSDKPSNLTQKKKKVDKRFQQTALPNKKTKNRLITKKVGTKKT
ncbi:putative ATP-dependent RNA helicase Dbp45A [Lucilia cuprina]|uniref:RNA helicase n=1 Tax=Lucilia cuprina TaxID=7375 RepID=A0A0L0C6Z2_LUCCU|nr:putative ATP-dependent RNA helicase Dbp45A [Lucilia cuprina]KNC27204.1 putative ATP-dependent RNA helicase Dbp45A [Lucilia cuprina]